MRAERGAGTRAERGAGTRDERGAGTRVERGAGTRAGKHRRPRHQLLHLLGQFLPPIRFESQPSNSQPERG